MNEISKVSDITVQDLWDYLHPSEPMNTDEQNTLDSMLGVAKTFIKDYTGQDDLDAYQDFVIVTLVLCQDMYDNRTLYVDSTNLSHVVQTVLGMHSVNLL